MRGIKDPDAFLKIGLVQLLLGKTEEAEVTFKKIRHQFPGTRASETAAMKLTEIKMKYP